MLRNFLLWRKETLKEKLYSAKNTVQLLGFYVENSFEQVEKVGLLGKRRE